MLLKRIGIAIQIDLTLVIAAVAEGAQASVTVSRTKTT
jgi:hypothetical protein